MSSSQASAFVTKGGFKAFILCLGVVLAVLFVHSFLPGWVQFSNDGPLGALNAAWLRPGPSLTGQWLDIYWLGQHTGSLPLDLNSLFQVLGPVGYSKFMPPLSVLFLGICAWVFFRQMKLAPMLCLVASLAAALNMNFFSNVCWGLGTRALTLGWTFLALAVLLQAGPHGIWQKIVLAGFAVGMAVVEGADNGAIFSLYVAAFAVFMGVAEEKLQTKAVLHGVIRVAVVALAAGIIAAHAIYSLVGTQIQGVAELQKQEESSESRWNWATQWSLPKLEALRVIIPGLYGYRMDAPNGANYWGSVGQDANAPQILKALHDPSPEIRAQAAAWLSQGSLRSSGSGEFAGVLVVLVALWAIAQSCRKKVSLYSNSEKKWIWFWTITALISLLIAFGRHAPVYALVYHLPFFANIRNPMKFMHPFHLSLMILFGYGLLALGRSYLEPKPVTGVSGKRQVSTVKPKGLLANLSGFDRRWTIGCCVALAVSLVGGLVYANSRKDLESYLENVGFDPIFGYAPSQVTEMARHSITEVGWFVVFLALSIGLLTMILRGTFAGRKAGTAAVLLGILVVLDLGRADVPWIRPFNYVERYASNPVLDVLRQQPNEHRVVWPRFRDTGELGLLHRLYAIEWLQHEFPYYNIQSLDIPQDPRMATEKVNYLQRVGTNIVRLWELTNTRYLFGLSGEFLSLLNQKLDPGKERFKYHTLFTASYENGLATAQTNNAGPYALIEFTGALPRAKLYAQWQINTNDQEVLQQLSSPAFEPTRTVLISSNSLPATAASAADANTSAGSVQITSYAPKRVVLETQAEKPAVLLLNDKYDPNWKVWIDGQPGTVLRANYLMRAVYLPGGKHTIVFRFEPPLTSLYISLVGLTLAVLLCGFLLFSRRMATPAQEQPGTHPLQPKRP